MNEETGFEAQEPEDSAPTATVEELQAELEARRNDDSAAANTLRNALLAGEPALTPEMLEGETVAQVEASYRRASAILASFREYSENEAARKVPAGAPGRSRYTPRTPFDKIRVGLEKLER